MRRIIVAALFLVSSFAAEAQTYLVFPTLAACLARSQAQCAAVGCNGTSVVYWWACQVLATATVSGGANGTGGTTAIVVQPGTQFDTTTTNGAVASTKGFSTAEQAAVQTPTQLGSALPYMISTITFDARFTTPQKTAITGSAQSAAWTTIQGSALVNLDSPSITAFVSAIVALGIIPASQALTVLAHNPPIVSP